MRTPTEIIDSHLVAYNARDIEAFLAHFADHAFISDIPSNKVWARGKAEIREKYLEVFAQSPGLKCEVINRIAHKSMVVDHERVLNLRGRPEIFAAVTYQVVDGLIVAAWFLDHF